MKLHFSRQAFKKYSNIKFHENLSIRSRVAECGRTDKQDESNKLFAILRMSLKKFRMASEGKEAKVQEKQQ